MPVLAWNLRFLLQNMIQERDGKNKLTEFEFPISQFFSQPTVQVMSNRFVKFNLRNEKIITNFFSFCFLIRKKTQKIKRY